MNTDKTWTDERIESLKTLWNDGLSASQIAAELSDHRTSISRNSVLSKVHRLGISDRPNGRVGRKSPWHGQPRTPRTPQGQRAGSEDRRVGRQRLPSGALEAGTVDIIPTDYDLAIPREQRKTMLQLRFETPSRPGDCRWPLGHPGTADFAFCGAEAEMGKPYCTEHCRRAFTSAPVRRAYHNYQPGARYGTQASSQENTTKKTQQDQGKNNLSQTGESKPGPQQRPANI